jgi:hypothetical protein
LISHLSPSSASSAGSGLPSATTQALVVTLSPCFSFVFGVVLSVEASATTSELSS